MSTFGSTFVLLLVIYIFPGECNVLYRQAGDNVSLVCCVLPKTRAEWKVDGELDIISIYVDDKRQVQTSASHLISNRIIHADTLTISKLQRHYSGDYYCDRCAKEYTLRVVSVFVQPDRKLLQSSDAELHCNVGDAEIEVQWLRPPNGQQHNERKQVIKLKSVTSDDEGQWTCLVQDLKINVTLTVRGLLTYDVEAHQGGAIVLPCSLPWVSSKRVLHGKWKADHRPNVSFPTLQSTNGILHWEGQNSSEVAFTSGQLSTNFDIMLLNVQPSEAGSYVCSVEFEGGMKLTASTKLTVVRDVSGKKKSTIVKWQKLESEGPWTKDVFGVQLCF